MRTRKNPVGGENVLSWVMLSCESHVFLVGSYRFQNSWGAKHCSVMPLFDLGFDVNRSSRSSCGGMGGRAWEG